MSGAHRMVWALSAGMSLGLVSACDGGGDDASPVSSSPVKASSTTAPPRGCLAASRSFLSQLGVFPAYAVVTEVPAEGSGLAEKGRVWFVSSASGATWVTSADPTSDRDEGIVLPLNAEARKASPVGAGTPAGAPDFEGLSDATPEAARSRACAGAPPAPAK